MKQELTKEERDLIPVVRDEWIARSLDCSPMDKAKACKGIKWIYEFSGYAEPQVLYAESPAHANVIINILMKDPHMGLSESITDEVKLWIIQAVAAVFVRARLYYKQKKVHPTDLNMIDMFGDYYHFVEGEELEYLNGLAELILGTAEKMYDEYKGKDIDYYRPAYYGDMQDYSWASYADYYHRIQAFEYDWGNYLKFKEHLESNIYQAYCYDTHAILCQKPKYFRLDTEQQRLHCENGPAVEWADGYDLYFLEGLNMDKNFVMAKPEEIDPSVVIEEQNTERRRVMIKKIGYDRLLDSPDTSSKMVEEIDLYKLYKKHPVGNWYQHGDVIIKPADGIKEKKVEFTDEKIEKMKQVKYQLVNLKIRNEDGRLFLVMNDFTTGERYAEGVPPNTKTVYEALKFRNGTDYLPCNFA